jgi:MYXO-CTERM domain-containing protein
MRKLIPLSAVVLIPLWVAPTSAQDLSVKDFAYTAVDSEVTYSVKACGDSGTNTTVGVYHNPQSPPTTADTPDASTGATADFTCPEVTLSWSNAAIGLYKSYVLIDPKDLVSEGNENNNLAGPIEVCVGPYVVIKDGTFSVESQGAAVTYKATVCNNGSMAAKKFRVGFWHDRSTPPSSSDMGDIFKAIALLKAGECLDIQVSGGLRPNGSFTAWCRPDSGDFVKECREDKPALQLPYSLSNPDLDVVSVDVKVSGSSVTYTAQVCNKGTAAVSKFFTDIYYDRPKMAPVIGEPGDVAKPTAQLAPGACTTITYQRDNAPQKTYTSYVFADPDDFISEPNESNNLSSPLPVKVGSGGNGPTPSGPCTDSDGDGYGVGSGCEGVPDCDDGDDKTNPETKEICGDAVDQDCDLTPDDGCPGVDCKDGDGDGFGVGQDCVLPDCDDKDKGKFPWAKETCGDNKDDNCNKIADDGCKGRQCVDQDMDGFGVGAGCPGQQDCDDTDFSVKPGVKDQCGDGLDNDCDNAVDDDDGCSSSTDGDGDGSSVGGGATGQPDCNDKDPTIGPGQKEICDDGQDNDCDGTVDDGCPGVDCTDQDGDSWGVGGDCKITDCDDTDGTKHPWAAEICGDNKDNDCDGTIDDGCPGVDCKDIDGDGWGVGKDCCNDSGTKVACRQDCSDMDGGASPWAGEICADDKDNNCDGSIDEGCPLCEDLDKDGHGIGPKCTTWDCDDSDAASYPGAEERCNEKDNDCDGVPDDDCTGEEAGCSCRVGHTAAPLFWLLWALAGLLMVLVHRRRR